MESNYHQTVLVKEAIDGLHIKKLAKYIDATLGTGGHSLEIVKAGGLVLGIDLDPEMVKRASSRLETEIKSKKAILTQGNFTEMDKIAKEFDFSQVSGVMFDLGVSNIHLKSTDRGFSFDNPEADLDMRINPETQGLKAADLLNALREDQLKEMFEATLEPGAAKWISGRVLHSRALKPIATVSDLLEISEGLKTGKKGLNEATLPFLALRIAVNSELDNLTEGLSKAFKLLVSGGRLVVISFHSKEDRIAKDFFREKVSLGEAKAITFKPISASDAEIQENKKARSAKLRIIEKI